MNFFEIPATDEQMSGLNSLKEFKDEFRLICSDTWGNALDAWFECAGQMNKRGLLIPYEWEYRPGLGGDGTDEDSYWFELFENTNDDLLINIGNFLFRYCQFLRHCKVDY